MKRTTADEALAPSEEELAALLAAKSAARTPAKGWLRAARRARGISQRQLATKLGCKRQAWAQLEMSEAREAISLYSLRRAAGAMGYDLVYFLVPREGRLGRAEPKVGEEPGGQAVRADGPAPAPVDLRSIFDGSTDSELPTELR